MMDGRAGAARMYEDRRVAKFGTVYTSDVNGSLVRV